MVLNFDSEWVGYRVVFFVGMLYDEKGGSY